MDSIGYNLQKLGVMALLSLVLMNIGCEDRIDNPKENPSVGEIVEVSLNIAFADDDEGAFQVATRSNIPVTGQGQQSAFDVQLSPAIQTRAGSVKPQSLYNLEIRQYNTTTKQCMNTSQAVVTELTIGTAFNAGLSVSDECTLIIVAWGTTVSQRLGTGDLSTVSDVSVDQSNIINLNPELQTDMNKMPYYIHLPKVKVTSDGKITSPDGVDVRLLLKRLATRVNLEWTYSASNYTLKQARLESVPTNYRVIPSPDNNGTYPSLLDQYTTLIIPDEKINPNNNGKGTYSCWMPASVRGERSAATSAIYRTKANAPTGSVYATFIAQNNTAGNENKKLNYRLYLGGNTSSDFNLYPNTNYNYIINFKHTQLPVNDSRVTIIDPIPASENNSNFVPTANCFMVAPGGAFCFDPFKFRQNGTDIINSTLKNWAESNGEGGIAYVKLLWQTKENGDVGDPAMGVENSADDHTNIVDIKKTNGGNVSKTSPLTGADQGRIYCRVAPNTTGGSGLIAAYNINDEIIWSWHVWVTDYSPSNTDNETVLEPVNKRKLRLYANKDDGTINQCIMMDRNLGAYTGYTEVPGSILDMSKANGFHYQKGRKDPFPGSYTSKNLPSPYNFTLSQDYPPKNMLNRYKADGITWIIPTDLAQTSLRNASKNPISIARNNGEQWCSDNPLPQWGETKTVTDPCPTGWRMPGRTEIQILVDYNQANSLPDLFTDAEAHGGLLLKYDGTANRTYLRFTGYPPNQAQLNSVGRSGYMTMWDRRSVFTISGSSVAVGGMRDYDAHTTRCIQE